MSLQDEMTAVKRCLDDLVRTVGRLEQSLARKRAGTEFAPPVGRPRRRPGHHPRHPVRQHAVDGFGRRGPGRTRPASSLGGAHRRGPRRTAPHSVCSSRPLVWRNSLATGTEPPPVSTRQAGTGVRGETRAAIASPHLRTDRWWLAPAVTAAGLLAFIVYSTWRAFANSRLLRGALRLTLLLALSGGQLRTDAARPQLGPVRQLVGPVPRAADPDLPAGLPADLLLLPQGLLPRLLGLAAGLRRRRTAREVHG